MLHLRRSAGPISTLHRCCEAQCVPFNAQARLIAHRGGGYSMRDGEVDLINSRNLSKSMAVFSKRAVGPFPNRSVAQSAADIPSGNLRDVE